MSTIRKRIICVISLFAAVCFSDIYANAQSGSKDMFTVAKVYAKNSLSSEQHETVVLDKGLNQDDVLKDKINEMYLLALANKQTNDTLIENNDHDNNDASQSTNADNVEQESITTDKYPNQDSYFKGTVDFTDVSLSKRDAALNSWSAINKSYDVYDDGGEDNVTIIATAYTSAAEENGGYEGMNAIGGRLDAGCIAAPKDISFQTKIRISGLGVFNVEDRGGAIVRVNENTIRIDVWMGSYREAMKFGKRVYKGRILPNRNNQ